MEPINPQEPQRPSRADLDSITRGSMVKVIDPEKSVWYWVVIERRLEDHQLVGRIDAHCVIGPTFRHGGTVAFHEDNVLYIWPTKVDPIFDRRWFRIVSHILSFGAGMKALKRATHGI
jgi:hypothetical protein